MSSILYNPLSVAPMIGWTYNHFRVFMRCLAPHALLYTEMQTTGAVLNNPQRALSFESVEHPIALQLGGSDPQSLAECVHAAENRGYDEINLNLGCPSDKVQAGRFGACLMKEPQRVAGCIAAMKAATTNTPITAKTRIGVDKEDSYAYFRAFVHTLVEAGCDKLVVHARKAWLRGLNPKQNRNVPPVHYEYVYRIKKELPHLPVVINGNVTQATAVQEHLQQVDGVMLGRLACDNPYKIAKLHQMLYPKQTLLRRSAAFQLYLPYLMACLEQGASLSLLIKPLFNLTFGLQGSRQWKKKLICLLQSRDLALLAELGSDLLEIECLNDSTHGILA